MNAEDCIDLAALERLRKLRAGVGLVRDMIAFFLDLAPRRVAEAQAGVAAGSCEAVRQAVHSLRSTAGNVGAHIPQQLAGRIEQLAVEKNLPALTPLVAELQVAVTAAKARLEEIRKTLA